MDAERIYRRLADELEFTRGIRAAEHPEVAAALRRAAAGAEARLRHESRVEVTLPFLAADGEEPVHLSVLIQRP
ncbi:MAG: hypothetical protein D084_Lepto4C00646G0003 [Leptospirillum sp. Group IV 'UBA BS']|nr:MAG: hypothetical protein D084_Lepto4C00646G0003 [Leptospirillum sp. Group IV 'UBA BS']